MMECNTSKIYYSIVILKVKEIRKSIFRFSTCKEREDISVSLPYVGQADRHSFSHVFAFNQLLGNS